MWSSVCHLSEHLHSENHQSENQHHREERDQEPLARVRRKDPWVQGAGSSRTKWSYDSPMPCQRTQEQTWVNKVPRLHHQYLPHRLDSSQINFSTPSTSQSKIARVTWNHQGIQGQENEGCPSRTDLSSRQCRIHPSNSSNQEMAMTIKGPWTSGALVGKFSSNSLRCCFGWISSTIYSSV